MRLRSLFYSSLFLMAFSGCATDSQFDLRDVDSPYAKQYTWAQGKIYHTPTGTELTEKQLYEFLAGFSVIYVGESHDSVDDHEVQLKILKALEEHSPGGIALGLEMLRTDSQAEVNRWVAGDLSESDMKELWEKNWGPSSYPYYENILNYVREQKIPLVALNLPKEKLSLPENSDADSEDNTVPPVKLKSEDETNTFDPYYEAYIGAFLSGHGHELSARSREQFIRAQQLWDETMAESAADFLLKKENRSRKLIIFAGGNHVRYGFGIPRRLFRHIPVSYTIVLPTIIEYPEDKKDNLMDVALPELPLPAADIIWMVGYKSLEE